MPYLSRKRLGKFRAYLGASRQLARWMWQAESGECFAVRVEHPSGGKLTKFFWYEA